jgi:hypothetical protein
MRARSGSASRRRRTSSRAGVGSVVADITRG